MRESQQEVTNVAPHGKMLKNLPRVSSLLNVSPHLIVTEVTSICNCVLLCSCMQMQTRDIIVNNDGIVLYNALKDNCGTLSTLGND